MIFPSMYNLRLVTDPFNSSHRSQKPRSPRKSDTFWAFKLLYRRRVAAYRRLVRLSQALKNADRRRPPCLSTPTCIFASARAPRVMLYFRDHGHTHTYIYIYIYSRDTARHRRSHSLIIEKTF